MTNPLPRTGKITAAEVDPRGYNATEDVVRVPGMRYKNPSSRVGNLLHNDQRGHKERGQSKANDDTTTDEDFR